MLLIETSPTNRNIVSNFSERTKRKKKMANLGVSLRVTQGAIPQGPLASQPTHAHIHTHTAMRVPTVEMYARGALSPEGLAIIILCTLLSYKAGDPFEQFGIERVLQ